MDENIEKFIEDTLKIENETSYQFKEICGFTFVFKQTTIILRGRIASCEIKPVGIIYSENDEIYYAPLNERGDIKEIVKEYCR